MIRKIVGKFVKSFQRHVQKTEEKIDCVSKRKPIVDFTPKGINLHYDTYTKSLGIMNMVTDGDWLKVEDFKYLVNKICAYYSDEEERLEYHYEKLLTKQEKEIIFLKQVRVVLGLGLGLIFNIVLLVVSFN